MDHEQKYKNALERAKKLYEKGTITESIGYIFPELAESEDEKIKNDIRGLIEFALEDGSAISPGRNTTKEEALAWLEKQGTSYTKKDVDDAYIKGINDTKNEIEKQYEASYQIRKDIATFIFNYRGDIKDRAKWMDYLGVKVYVFEKEGEKPRGKTVLEAIKEEKIDNANRVEPKFKIGDWITDGEALLCISKFEIDYGYELKAIDGEVFHFVSSDLVDTSYHLWSIEDAKPGDVLCYKDEISLFKHDIKDCTKQETTFGGFVYYCCYYGKRFIMDSLYSLTEQDKINIHPATEEQRDYLFKKMHEAGYRWDAEKIEIKKIETKGGEK